MKKTKNLSNEVNRLINQVWSIAEILRGKMDSDSYYIILYLLSLYKDDLIKDANYESVDTLNKHLDGNNKKHSFYFGIHLVFIPDALKIGKAFMTEIITNLFQINKIVLKENFPEIFESILFSIAQSQGKKGGDFVQPIELTKFMYALAEIPKNGSVFNPFAGLASFGFQLDKGLNYLGQEINQKTWAIALLRLFAKGNKADFTFNQADTFAEWPKIENFDLIISNPPLGLRLKNRHTLKSLHYSSAEEFLIDNGLNSLNKDGKVVTVVSNGFLFRGGSEKELRKELINNNILNAVISLPAGLLYSSAIPINIIIIDKKKTNPGKVKFIDGSDYYLTPNKRQKILDYSALLDELGKEESSKVVKYVSNGTIIKNDFNLNIGRYFAPEIEGSPLKKIISRLERKNSRELDKGKFVRIRDLKDSKLDYVLRAREVGIENLPRSTVQLIDQSCMLLALRWSSLKPTYFEYEGTPILISNDIQAYQIDEEKVFIDYLFYELHSEYVQDQVLSYSTGSTVPCINREDLLNIKIELPPFSEQKSKIKGVKELSKEVENIKRERNLLAHGTQSKQFDEFASLKHTLGRPRQNIVDWAENLIDHFSTDYEGFKKINDEFKDFYDLDVIEALQEIKRDINFITEVLEKGENGLILKNYSKEIISLFEINKAVKGISENGFKFKIGKELLEGEGLNSQGIGINAVLLKTLLDNLLTNANKHAFDSKSKGNVVKIKLDIIEDLLTLEFKDNGKGFPKNYNKEKFITKYSTANPENGTGLGGYDIDRIAAYSDNPDWDLILNEDPIYKTIFRFQFPIKPIK